MLGRIAIYFRELVSKRVGKEAKTLGFLGAEQLNTTLNGAEEKGHNFDFLEQGAKQLSYFTKISVYFLFLILHTNSCTVPRE